MSDSSTLQMKRTRMNTDWHKFLSVFIRVNLCPILRCNNLCLELQKMNQSLRKVRRDANRSWDSWL